MRDALGDGYVEAVRRTIKAVPESADFVMYWWNHAADLVRQGRVRRFGFVTTNSLRQTFNRRVLEKHLNASPNRQLSLLFAIPDHPWVDDIEAAAVRVAMTVAEAGTASGLLQTVESEEPGDESFKVAFNQLVGKIAADLTVGADVGSSSLLQSNDGISNNGVILGGRGFHLDRETAEQLGLGESEAYRRRIRRYLSGRCLTTSWQEAYVIDLFGMTENEVRSEVPEIFQWVLTTVKPHRDQNKRASRREKWWLFNESVPKLRRMLAGLPRFIGTTETAKHRFFTFIPGEILPDHMIISVALDDAFHLGVLSSRIHVTWALATGGTLEDRPRYNKSRCFETFPFPDCTDAQKARIRELGEALDAHRKSRQAAHPDLTMTGMYNVLEKLRSGDSLTAKEKTIHEQGLVSILKQLHDDLDVAVAEAYGWPADLPDEEILTRLVALNHKRAEEEKNGHIRWLRPEYQDRDQRSEVGGQQEEIAAITATSGQKTKDPAKREQKTFGDWPRQLPDQIRAVRSALDTISAPADATAIAKLFINARKDRIEAILESLQALGHAHEVEDGRYSA